MNRNVALGGVLVAVLLLAGIGMAAFTGGDPVHRDDPGDTMSTVPTETPPDDGNPSVDTDDAPPFSLTIDEVDECGQTCRDVTATLHNDQTDTANRVIVSIAIYAGEDSTDEDDLVWEGSVDVGTLEAGASYTTTERVELSYWDSLAVSRNDGWITIHTTVESDERTVTFRDSEQVA